MWASGWEICKDIQMVMGQKALYLWQNKTGGKYIIYIYSSRHWLVTASNPGYTLVKLSLPFMAYPVNGWTKIMVIQLFTTPHQPCRNGTPCCDPEANRCLSSRACKFFAQCSAAPGSPSKASSKQVGSWTAEDSAAITVEDGGLKPTKGVCN